MAAGQTGGGPPPGLSAEHERYEQSGEETGGVKETRGLVANLPERVIFPPARYLDVTVRLLPRDEKFFDLFTAVATFTVEAARIQQELLRVEHNRRSVLVDQIKRLEHQADQVTHDVVTRLDRVFITPLDREDIHLLASRLDDVIDLIDGTARRLQIFHAGAAPDGAMMIAEVIVRASEQLQVAVAALEKNKDGTVLGACVQIKRLEEEGDSLYHEWLGRLFEGQPDALTVIKWKEIYDNLEKTLDDIENASNVLESISIKHA
jgi:predicted phosphate transport protein (TIGR00153 family)